MRRPRILLVPHFSELDWRIKPLLEEWAQVASFDAPGVGDEPTPDAFRSRRWSSGASRSWTGRGGTAV